MTRYGKIRKDLTKAVRYLIKTEKKFRKVGILCNDTSISSDSYDTLIRCQKIYGCVETEQRVSKNEHFSFKDRYYLGINHGRFICGKEMFVDYNTSETEETVIDLATIRNIIL